MYNCVCEGGYTGVNCESDLDDCANEPCQHGTCSDFLNFFTCTCDTGFTGSRCNSDINECASNPCVHGMCINELAQFTCNCSTGYQGELCDVIESGEGQCYMLKESHECT